MTKAFVLGLVLFSQLAIAGHRQNQNLSVDQMTCAQAQASVKKTADYWKFVGNDLIHIYPVKQLEDLRCKTKEFAAPIFETVIDEEICVLGFYCRSQ